VNRYRFIDAEKANHSVSLLCRTLRVSRSAFYAWLSGSESRRMLSDRRLAVHIKAIHRESRGTYGSPRVHAVLQRQGVRVGRRRVARLMAQAGLAGLPRKRFKTTTVSDPALPVAPNLLERNFVTNGPNQVWVADITYIPTGRGWLYLAVVIDLYSRKVVGWHADTHVRTELCLTALRMAVTLRKPDAGWIHHSDRGCQYASRAYQVELGEAGARCSMSRLGDCWDNAVAESFFGTLKTELIHRKPWVNREQARVAISRWIVHVYNDRRLHSQLGYETPNAFELSGAA